MSQRLLFWTSLSPCYHQLFGQQVNEKKTEGENADHRRYSNAPDIELDDEDEEKAVGTQVHSSQRPQRPIAPISLPDSEARPVYQDVARGGYPTFSGSGLTDTERQVPTGFLERSKDGRIIKFISEKGEEVEKPILPNDEGYRKEGKLSDKTRMGHSSGQKGKEQSFNQKGSGDQLPPTNHPKRVPVFLMNSEKIQGGISARGMEDGKSSKTAALSRTRSVEIPRRQTADKMQKLLVAENNTQSDSLDPERQPCLSSISGLSATGDLGPQFPLPPDGQGLGKFRTQLALLPRCPALEEKSTVAMPLKKGVGSMRGLALPRSRSDKEMPHIDTNRQNLKTNAEVDEEPPASAPPLPPAPSLPKTFLAPKISQRKRAITLSSHLNLQQPIRSSFTTVSRNWARSAKSTRLARVVRFVDKVDEKSPSPPITEGTLATADSHDTNKNSEDEAEVKIENTRRSVRIPRTNFHLPLPIIGTFKKEATRPESCTSSSTDSSSFDLKIDREEPITRTQRGDSNRFAGDRIHNRRRSDEKADLPRLGRPKTVAFPDGGYLSGEREINSIRRPSSLSIDSRSSREMS